jgi:hypothetical protein
MVDNTQDCTDYLIQCRTFLRLNLEQCLENPNNLEPQVYLTMRLRDFSIDCAKYPVSARLCQIEKT